jgi:hypothetical protein
MRRDRRRLAAGPERRRSRRLRTLERLEARCVLSGSAPWPAPVNPLVSEGHGNLIASSYVAPPSSNVVEPTMKTDDYSLGHSNSSSLWDSHNGRSLTLTGSVYVFIDPYSTITLTISDPMERSFWIKIYNQKETDYYYQHGTETEGGVDKPVVSSGGSGKVPSTDYGQTSTSTQYGTNSSYYNPLAVPPGGSTHGPQTSGPDLSVGTIAAVGYVNAVSQETMPASAASVAGAAQAQQSPDAGHVPQVGRSSVIDNSTTGPFNSATVTLATATQPPGDSSLGQTASMLRGDQQPLVNHALAGPRSLATTGARANSGLPGGHSLAVGEIVLPPEGKAALAELPLDLRRMEQALETVVSEVKLIGPEVARWFDGIHATPVTVAIAAAAVAGGSIYYLRRRGTRRADRPEDEASSSWLFARLQPTPE